MYSEEVSSKALLSDLFYRGNHLCAPSVMFRRTVTDKIGFFHRGLIQLQDYDYWLRALSCGFRIKVFSQGGVYYRRHKKNLSGDSRLPAARAEMSFILQSVLKSGDPGVLRAAFSDVLAPTVRKSVPLTALEKNIILMSHSRPEVKSGALTELLNHMDTIGRLEEEEKYDFNLLKYLYNAFV